MVVVGLKRVVFGIGALGVPLLQQGVDAFNSARARKKILCWSLMLRCGISAVAAPGLKTPSRRLDDFAFVRVLKIWVLHLGFEP